MSAVIETPLTDGVVLPPLQADTAVFGNPDAGSKGVVVSALETPKPIPDAEVGVPERLTVTVSAVSVPVALPYHSMCVVSWVPVHDTKDCRAVPCHVTPLRVSVIEETVIEAPEMDV